MVICLHFFTNVVEIPVTSWKDLQEYAKKEEQPWRSKQSEESHRPTALHLFFSTCRPILLTVGEWVVQECNQWECLCRLGWNPRRNRVQGVEGCNGLVLAQCGEHHSQGCQWSYKSHGSAPSHPWHLQINTKKGGIAATHVSLSHIQHCFLYAPTAQQPGAKDIHALYSQSAQGIMMEWWSGGVDCQEES